MRIFDAAREIACRFLCSPKERTCASFRRSGIKATAPPGRPHGLPSKVNVVLHGPKFDVSVLRNTPRPRNVGAVNERVISN
ncbi:MAG: hypothetical protein WA399_09485, partial [Acidobacteriaceae bacterium]